MDEQARGAASGPTSPIPEELVEPYVRDWLRSISIPCAKNLEEKLVSEVTLLLIRFPGVAV